MPLHSVPNIFEPSLIRKILAMSYAFRLYSLGKFGVLCYRMVLMDVP